MDIQAIKLEIIRKVTEAVDADLLRRIQFQLEEEDTVVGQVQGKTMTLKMLKDEITEARADYSEGRIHSHEEVKMRFQSRFNKG